MYMITHVTEQQQYKIKVILFVLLFRTFFKGHSEVSLKHWLREKLGSTLNQYLRDTSRCLLKDVPVNGSIQIIFRK